MSYGRPRFDLAYATFDNLAAYTRPAFNSADSEWTEPASVDSYVRASTPLGAALVSANQDPAALMSASSMLGSASVLAAQYPFALMHASSMLGMASIVANHDFTVVLDLTGALPYYTMDLVTPGGLVRVPISSWQATLQVGNQNYVGCVVPACTEWIDDLTTATEFIITRHLDAGNVSVSYEMARAPLGTLQTDQGPTNTTASISGYTPEFAENLDPSSEYDRQLKDIRSISSYTSGARVRCAIDWLLRPAQRALYSETSMVVSFLNYYVTMNGTDPDEYMDVGERI